MKTITNLDQISWKDYNAEDCIIFGFDNVLTNSSKLIVQELQSLKLISMGFIAMNSSMLSGNIMIEGNVLFSKEMDKSLFLDNIFGIIGFTPKVFWCIDDNLEQLEMMAMSLNAIDQNIKFNGFLYNPNSKVTDKHIIYQDKVRFIRDLPISQIKETDTEDMFECFIY